MKKNNLFLRFKQDKSARAVAITITVMLLVLTAIIITTVIANRAAANGELPDDSQQAGVNDPSPDGNDQGNQDPPTENPPSGNPPVTEKPDNTPTDTLPTQFLLPVSGVLQKSHDESVQVFSPTMGDYRIHLGIDIGTVAGASVAAMADGVITQIWEDVSMGQCVAVQHGGEALSIYKNLDAALPESTVVGATVKAGDVIGTVGESAMVEIAEEPHLHLEMTVNGIQVDPLEYLDEDARATLNETPNFEDAS
jgi:murein DD-endopeptidase MepM/ murein hydrolase activator NlpD